VAWWWSAGPPRAGRRSGPGVTRLREETRRARRRPLQPESPSVDPEAVSSPPARGAGSVAAPPGCHWTHHEGLVKKFCWSWDIWPIYDQATPTRLHRLDLMTSFYFLFSFGVYLVHFFYFMFVILWFQKKYIYKWRLQISPVDLFVSSCTEMYSSLLWFILFYCLNCVK